MGSKQRRIKEDLLDEVEDYPGDNTTERLRNWAEDHGEAAATPEDVREIVREEMPDIDAEIRDAVYELKEGRV
ncbi:MAG: hypothetical protein ABEI97_00460 [Candidatus Nanohaloarchaea archaeon]